MWKVVEELRQLMKAVPMYSAHFLSILNEVLIGYRDSLRNLYKGTSVLIFLGYCMYEVSYISTPLLNAMISELTAGPGEGGVAGGGAARHGSNALGAGQQDAIISSKWARDDDIKRMIM